MTKYIVIKEDSLDEFHRKVNDLLKEGWECHGHFIALRHADLWGCFWYFQSMVKKDG